MTGFAVQLPRIGVFKILRRIAHLYGDGHGSLFPFGPVAAASSRCVRESSTPATRPDVADRLVLTCSK